ncbi:MAG: hypothetical protein WB947_02690 [Thermoplasmata archaeon]
MNITYLAAALTIAVLGALNLVLLIVMTDRGAPLRAGLRRSLERLTGSPDLHWLRWWHVAAVVTGGFLVVLSFDFANGLYACTRPGSPTDIGGFLAQGQALWAGTNPFLVTSCGGTIPEPDGLAAVLINGLGSVGGLPGIAAVWAIVAIALVPLTWYVAGPERRYLTLVVATSPLYFPLVSSQIDGASNALVPLAVLLALYLASRRELLATGLAGFLATQRFPTLFPVLALSGSLRRRWAAAFALIAVFAAGTGLSYILWGSVFVNTVFLNEIGRRAFSLNLWGILLLENALPAGDALPLAQALVTLVLVGVVFFTVKSPLRAAAITLTGVALLDQFLSFNILIWLLPAALVGARPRWWLWGIAIVGSVDYNYAYTVLVSTRGILWPAAVLDGLLTVLLLGLFIDLWRSSDPPASPGVPASSSPSPDPTRIMGTAGVSPADEGDSPPVPPNRASPPLPVSDVAR